ncbi:hypothetical protein [Kutzneria kofuensis]|uniref:hypothetical protein n=1 Tax=Kutzneria kofuensis TaxID=103725 RepID=UPI0031E5AC7C
MIGTYASGQWHRTTLSVDTVNQRFNLDIDGRRVLTDAGDREGRVVRERGRVRGGARRRRADLRRPTSTN